jgi:O-methyltransferase
MIAAISELTARRAVLFDSFEGLPPARDIDGPAAMAWQSDTSGPDYHDNCSATEHEARRVMRLARTDYEIYKGWFSDTVPRYARPGNRISILRLDGDWYDSTVLCLNHLFPLVAPGGVVLIDDYGTWDGCARAVHDYLSSVNAPEPIDRTPRGVAFIVKHARD